MHIEKRPSKKGFRYRVRVALQGYPLQTKTFSKKSDAVEWGRALEADLSRGILGSPRSFEITLSQAIRRFKEERPPGYGAWLFDRRNWRILSWWEEEMGRSKLSDLRPRDIIEARERIRKGINRRVASKSEEKPRSPSTVNTYIAGISTVLQVSLELWGWIEENPCRKIRRLRVDNERVRTLSEDEKSRLFKVCSDDDELMDVILLALLTGARQGELCELKWDHIDFEGGLLFFMNTKNKTHRVLPLSEEMLVIFQKRRLNSFFAGSEWVFPDKVGDGPITVKYRFRKRVKKAGIEDFRFHDLRHCAGSALTRANVPEMKIQKIMGHKTVQMTKRYSHLRPSDIKKEVSLLAEAAKEKIE